MTTFDSLIERNKDFAVQQTATHSPILSLPQALPNVKALIIGCVDMRVDPTYVLGIKPGEAVVIRNIGGRVTPGTLQMLGLLGEVSQVAQAIPGGGDEFHLIVFQHTDCGITRLIGEPDMLADYFDINKDEVEAKKIADPRAAVIADVNILKANPALPSQWLVSGLVLDIATGLVEVVVPPTPLGNTER